MKYATAFLKVPVNAACRRNSILFESLFPCPLKSPQPCGFEGFYFAIFGIFLLKLYSPLYKGFSRLYCRYDIKYAMKYATKKHPRRSVFRVWYSMGFNKWYCNHRLRIHYNTGRLKKAAPISLFINI